MLRVLDRGLQNKVSYGLVSECFASKSLKWPEIAAAETKQHYAVNKSCAFIPKHRGMTTNNLTRLSTSD